MQRNKNDIRTDNIKHFNMNNERLVPLSWSRASLNIFKVECNISVSYVRVKNSGRVIYLHIGFRVDGRVQIYRRDYQNFIM